MAISPDSRARFNLSRTVVLLFDPTPMGLSILVGILTGLGARNLHRCHTLEEAKDVVAEFEVDLMICDSVAESGEGYDFVSWLRQNAREPNRHAPVLMTTAHTRVSDVAKARDCGGHFIVAKPLAPIVMLERIIWIAREGRAFLLSDNYVGPDRRFGKKEAAPGAPRRRREDAEASLARVADDVSPDGDASSPYESQQPMRAAS